MPLLLTVIYDKHTGEILKTVNAGTITRRNQLQQYVPDHPLNHLAFYYEEQSAPIDIINDRIKRLVHGAPPVLCDATGFPKVFPIHIAGRWKAISFAHSLKVDFEGGMGDQILQLQAIKELALLLPKLAIEIGIRPQYTNIAPYLEHHGDYTPSGKPPNRMGQHFYVNQHTQYISDPRGGLYGKASLYGANIGLQRVQQHISFSMPWGDSSRWIQTAGLRIQNLKRPLLGIHIRSGSGGAKSWNHEPALKLAYLWHSATSGSVYLIGDPADYGTPPPWAFTTPKGSDWASVAAIIAQVEALVAIDSGPMHLGLAADIPTIILWGGTGPDNILGRSQEPTDIRANIPCIDNVCYSCPLGTSLCMRAITPNQVWEALQKNFPEVLQPKCEVLTLDAATISAQTA